MNYLRKKNFKGKQMFSFKSRPLLRRQTSFGRVVSLESVSISFHYSVLWRNDECGATGGVAAAMRFKEVDDVDVFIGPPCSGCKCFKAFDYFHHFYPGFKSSVNAGFGFPLFRDQFIKS